MSRRAALLFAAMGFLWGIPYVLIKVAVSSLTPATLVFFRTAIGAALLVPMAARRRQLAPLLEKWRPLLAYTLVELAVPWILLSTAETRLPSSLSGLLVAAVPLVGAVLTTVSGTSAGLGPSGVGGLALGLAGVGCLVGFDVSGGDLLSVAMVGAVAVGYAVGPLILSRHLHDRPNLGVVAASLALCAAAYAPFALTELPAHLPRGRVLGAVAVLGCVCTALAFLLFFELIREVGPVRATVITYINPAVAVVLGVVFLHEGFGLATAAGFVLILAGSYFATARRRHPPATDTEPAVVGEP